jgi:DNA polymerase-3 subunit alpha
MKPKFISQAAAKGHPEDRKYGKTGKPLLNMPLINRTLLLCGLLIKRFLKAIIPEYMAAVLSNNMSDIKQVSFFMEECKRIDQMTFINLP